MKVKFLQAVEVEAQGKVEQKFKKGQVKDLPDTSAERWIRRGIAAPVSDDKREKKGG